MAYGVKDSVKKFFKDRELRWGIDEFYTIVSNRVIYCKFKKKFGRKRYGARMRYKIYRLRGDS